MGPNLQSYLFQGYISLNPILGEQKYTIHLLEMAKLIIEAGNVYFKLIIRYENKVLMILVFIFQHIPIFKQLLHFSSCHIFGTNLGFKTITRIHINQAFTKLRNKTRFFKR